MVVASVELNGILPLLNPLDEDWNLTYVGIFAIISLGNLTLAGNLERFSCIIVLVSGFIFGPCILLSTTLASCFVHFDITTCCNSGLCASCTVLYSTKQKPLFFQHGRNLIEHLQYFLIHKQQTQLYSRPNHKVYCPRRGY